MARPKSIISKAEFAQEIGVSKGRVSQLIQRGLPVRQDQKIDRNQAVSWYSQNILRPLNKGELPARQVRSVQPAAAPSTAAVPRSQLAARDFMDEPEQVAGGPVADGQREIVERIIAKCAELPEIFARLGCPLQLVSLVIAAAHSFIWEAVSDETVEELWGWSGPPSAPDPDLAKIAAAVGVPIEPEKWEVEAEEIAERVLGLFPVVFNLPEAAANSRGNLGPCRS